MRLLIVLLVIVFASLGALFGALNSEWIGLDFYLLSLNVPKGAALLAALLVGWLFGGTMVWLARVPALKRELRRARLRPESRPLLKPEPRATGSGVNE